MRFTFDGREVEMIERPTFAEAAMVERQAKTGFGSMTDVEQTAALTLISMRRAGIALTWDAVMAMSPADFQAVPEPALAAAEQPGDELVPTAAGAEAGQPDPATPVAEPEPAVLEA